MEKILEQTYVNPKVELSERDYNRLVELATMTAEKIEERARQFYEKEGVAKIRFEGRIASTRYFNTARFGRVNAPLTGILKSNASNPLAECIRRIKNE